MSGLTYREVGATAGELPAGYHHVHASRRIGLGRAAFETASAALMSWRMHERAGARRVFGPEAATVGRDVAFRWLVLRFECRVVAVVEEENRRGFTYGTLACHPESGEERFLVEFDPESGAVTATITAFSRPSSVLFRLSGPLARPIQQRMTRRYLDSMRELLAQPPHT